VAQNSPIEWTEVTWNPTTGCDRTSPGCDNCYALTLAKRLQAMGVSRYRNDGDPG
jgi:protein gp37